MSTVQGSCRSAGKRRYATRRAALQQAHALVYVAGGIVMRPYRCECGWWHLTRRRGSRLPAERSA